MKIKILVLIFIPFLISCNQEKITELENLLDEREITISELESRIAYLEQFESDLSIPNYSDEEVIDLFKQYINFTCPEVKSKDIQVRSNGNTQYVLSFLSINTSHSAGYWKRTIYNITFITRDEFNVKYQTGIYCG